MVVDQNFQKLHNQIHDAILKASLSDPNHREDLFIYSKLKKSSEALSTECALMKQQQSTREYFVRLCVISQLARTTLFWFKKSHERANIRHENFELLSSYIISLVEVIEFSINVINYQDELN